MYVMRNIYQRQDNLVSMVTVLLFVILSSTVGCSPWDMGAEKNVVKNGIKFDTFRENDDGTKFALNTYAAPVTYLEENTNLTRATWEDFTYIGAFRLQRGWKLTGGKFTAGGAIGVAGNTVYLRGRTDDGKMAIASVSIPELNPDASFEELPVAENVGEFIDIESHVEMGDNHVKNRMTSMISHNGYIIGGMIHNYDTNNADKHLLWRYDGEKVEGLFAPEGEYRAMGWITDVPYEWQADLGSTHIMGGGHNYSIVTRASVGPTAFGVNLDDVTADVVEEPIKTTAFMDFPFSGGHSLFKSIYPELTEQHGWENFRFNIEQILDPDCIDENGKKICSRHVGYPHPTGETLGNDIWISSARAGIGFIIPGTSTYAVIGTMFGMEHGASYRIIDNHGKKYTGPRPYVQEDWAHMVWLFDVNDFVKVKKGELEPHEVLPYEYHPISLPISTPTGVDGIYGIPRAVIKNGCSSGNRIYLSLTNGDDGQPVIVAFDVNTGDAPVPVPESTPVPDQLTQ